MTVSNPADALKEEHQVILKVVYGLAEVGEGLRAGAGADAALLAGAVRFMRWFADRCHHGKEEGYLFPAMEDKGARSWGCPFSALREQHRAAREAISALAAAVQDYARDPATGGTLARAIEGIVKLYPRHIWTEDNIVFPYVARVFNPREIEAIAGHFARLDASMPPGVYDSCRAFAEGIAGRSG